MSVPSSPRARRRLANRLAVRFFLVAVLTSAVGSATFWVVARDHARAELRTRLHDSVGIAALQLDGDLLAQVRGPDDRESPAFRTLRDQLLAIEQAGSDIAFVYTLRAAPDGGVEFAVDPSPDADTPAPGDPYEDAGEVLKARAATLDETVLEEEFYTDTWGTFLSGYAPIRSRDGALRGILAIDVEATQVAAYERQLGWIAAGIFLASAVLALAAGAIAGRRLAAPLVRASATLAAMTADGRTDLSARLPVGSSDELGLLAERFNQFVGSLQALLKEIASGTDVLTSASGDLTRTSETMAGDATQMRERAAKVAAAFTAASREAVDLAGSSEAARQSAANAAERSQAVSGDVTRISKGVASVSDAVTSIAAAIEQMTASLSEVAQGAARAAAASAASSARAASAREKMAGLGEASRGISRVVELIRDVAEQTNLLALNATIEAATAGEAGRGFAVVATEVKGLARQTSLATEQIRTQVEAMQTGTRDAIELIQTVSGSIEELTDLVTTIAAAVEQQSATTAEIARSVATGSETAGHISQSARTVAGGVDDVADEVHVASDTVTAMARTSRSVAAATRAVAEDLTEMDGLTERAAEAARSVRDDADAIATIAEDLGGRLGRFRL